MPKKDCKDEAVKAIRAKVWIEYDGEIVNGFLRALKKIDERSES